MSRVPLDVDVPTPFDSFCWPTEASLACSSLAELARLSCSRSSCTKDQIFGKKARSVGVAAISERIPNVQKEQEEVSDISD